LKIKNLHAWDVSIKDAIDIQRSLKDRIILKNRFKRIRSVAGADMSIADDQCFAGVVVYSFPDLIEIERQYATAEIRFPYVPGLLAFREGPVLLEAFAKLKNDPDVILFDGQGIAHPRGMGIASHMGLFLEKPTIGCAKSRLVGEHREPGQNAGDHEPLYFRKKIVGAVLRTRKNVKPIYVSPGHMIDIPASIEIVIACLDRTRIPKPTREADHFVSSLRIK